MHSFFARRGSSWRLLAGAVALGACGESADRAAASARANPACHGDTLRPLLHDVLGRMHQRNRVPGLSAAIYSGALAAPVAAVVGRTALDGGRALTPADRFLAGSVGKTFFAALALRRAARGELALDAPVAALMPGTGIAALDWITPRMLLTHTGGVGEYDGPFMTVLVQEPHRDRTRDDWLDVIRRTPPVRTAAGQFRYSDLNYVLLAMVLDAGAPGGAYAGIEREFIHPLGLASTTPSITRVVNGLVVGYDGAGSMFGQDAMQVNDTLVYNPQFEWGGGGFASTPSDLARWIAAFRNGGAFPDSLWPSVVARPPGTPDTASTWRGMGVHVGRGALGSHVGHSGYMPGYVSWVRWYDSLGVAVALQTNATDQVRLPDDGFDWMDSLAESVGTRCRERGKD